MEKDSTFDVIVRNIVKKEVINMIYGNILSFMSLGPMEMIMIAIVGLLIFGNRLPDVGRSLGKGLVEFKKGLKGVQDDIEQTDREIDKDTNHSADS